ncbi:hypothetical protein DXG03_006768, partial [Asterophora parasitica]
MSLDQLPITGLARKTSSSPREYIIALGQFGYTITLQGMMESIDDLDSRLNTGRSFLPRRRVPALDYCIPNDRIIGEVIHIESISVSVGPHKWTDDWALIALHESKFEWDKFKGNVVYIGGNLSSLDYGKIMFPRDDDRANYVYPTDGPLQARGVIPLDDCHNPTHLDANGEQCLLVLMTPYSFLEEAIK